MGGPQKRRFDQRLRAAHKRGREQVKMVHRPHGRHHPLGADLLPLAAHGVRRVPAADRRDGRHADAAVDHVHFHDALPADPADRHRARVSQRAADYCRGGRCDGA